MGLQAHDFKPLHKLLTDRKKEEDGLTTATVPLHLDPNNAATNSIMDKMGHQSSTIFPEQCELIRMWLRSCLTAYEESDYAKNTTVPHRGELDTSGFSDYLWFTAQLLAIDIGSNGGHRTGCYAKMASTNFEVVAEAVGKRPFGMWNADAFVKKCSGRGFKRAPHLIFDRGVNRGVIRRFKLLTDPHRRKPEWDKGIVGTGSDANPGNGIRLFLQVRSDLRHHRPPRSLTLTLP